MNHKKRYSLSFLRKTRVTRGTRGRHKTHSLSFPRIARVTRVVHAQIMPDTGYTAFSVLSTPYTIMPPLYRSHSYLYYLAVYPVYSVYYFIIYIVTELHRLCTGRVRPCYLYTDKEGSSFPQ